MRIGYTVAVLALAFGAGAAQAKTLMDYDTNSDGVITKAEFQAMQIDSFRRLDANGDGMVNAAEVEQLASQAGRSVSGSRILSRDGNNDGVVTESEYLTAAPGFDRADRNKDGVLAGNELARVAKFLAKANF